MKLSISFSDSAVAMLAALVQKYESNPSTVLEGALRSFVNRPEREREQMVRETHASKKMLTATGWRGTFWRVLAEEFNAVDSALDFPRPNLMAPRVYEGFRIVFLLSDIHNTNPNALIVHVMESAPISNGTLFLGMTRDYQITDSVYAAARDTAKWIKDNQPQEPRA